MDAATGVEDRLERAALGDAEYQAGRYQAALESHGRVGDDV